MSCVYSSYRPCRPLVITAEDSVAPSAHEARSTREFALILFSSGQITKQQYDSFLMFHKREASAHGIQETIGDSVIFKHSDHRRATETRVVSQIFNTPELLDLIFQQPDYSEKNILNAVKLTCKGFKSSFDASPTLQKRTEFAVFMTAQLPPVGPDPRNGRRFRYATEAMEAEDDARDAAKEQHYLSKFNVHVQGLKWLRSSHPIKNVFEFDFCRTQSKRGAFERYRTRTTFRNLRVCDEPLQRVR